MIIIKFPDGKEKEYKKGISAKEIAVSISENFAKNCISAKVNDDYFDLTAKIETDAKIQFITTKDENALEILRHSTAHIMAQAIQRLYKNVKFTIGPAVENGFYYDIDSNEIISEADFEKIENEMAKIIKEKNKD